MSRQESYSYTDGTNAVTVEFGEDVCIQVAPGSGKMYLTESQFKLLATSLLGPLNWHQNLLNAKESEEEENPQYDPEEDHLG